MICAAGSPRQVDHGRSIMVVRRPGTEDDLLTFGVIAPHKAKGQPRDGKKTKRHDRRAKRLDIKPLNPPNPIRLFLHQKVLIIAKMDGHTGNGRNSANPPILYGEAGRVNEKDCDLDHNETLPLRPYRTIANLSTNFSPLLSNI